MSGRSKQNSSCVPMPQEKNKGDRRNSDTTTDAVKQSKSFSEIRISEQQNIIPFIMIPGFQP